MAARLTGRLDLAALVRSIRQLVSEHTVLLDGLEGRATTDPELVTMAAVARSLSAEQEFLTATIDRPFDLEAGPLFRSAIATEGPEAHLLVLVAHHMVFDAWSARICARRLDMLYQHHCGGSPAAPTLSPASFADYVTDERTWLKSEASTASRAFWRSQFVSGADPRFGEADATGIAPSAPAGHHTLTIGAHAVTGLRAAARRSRDTLATVLLTVFRALVTEYTGAADVTIGVPIAHRPRREFESVIGLFMNALPIRIDLGSNPTFEELLKAARLSLNEAQTHGDWPFGALVNDLGCTDAASWVPFRTTFNFVNVPRRSLVLGGVAGEPMVCIPEMPSAADISCHVREAGDELVCTFIFKRDRLTAATIGRMGERMGELVTQCVMASGSRIAALID